MMLRAGMLLHRAAVPVQIDQAHAVLRLREAEEQIASLQGRWCAESETSNGQPYQCHRLASLFPQLHHIIYLQSWSVHE